MLRRLTGPSIQYWIAQLEARIPPWEGLGNLFLEPPAVCIGVRDFEAWTDPGFYDFLQQTLNADGWIVVPSGPLGRYVCAFDEEILPHGFYLDGQSLQEDIQEMFNGTAGLNSWVPMRYYLVSLDFARILIGDRRWEACVLVDLSGGILPGIIERLKDSGVVSQSREKIESWIWWVEGISKAAMVEHLFRWIGTHPSPSEPWASGGDLPD